MALANNPLLTALAAAKAQKASASTVAKAPQPVNDKASSFSSVFAKQAAPKPAALDPSPAKPASAKSSAPDDKDSVNRSSAAPDTTVADSGNGLPDKKVSDKADGDNAGRDKADSDDSDDADADGATLADVLPADSAGSVQPVVVEVAPPVVDAIADQPPAVDPALLAGAAQMVPVQVPVVAPAVVETPADATEEAFDPSSDPLHGLTAVQVALDSKAQGAHAASTEAGKTTAKQDPSADPAQQLAGNLAALGDKPVDDSTTESGGDQAFKGLLADGLKDVKGASTDTRVDNFAERLASLSQAAQVKTPATAAPLLNQSLAMNQGGWTEGLVNRVMYLSSQSIKQADITLEPAELGRLDIRVNMAADQQTQVTFMSAHVGVREALEGQMSRLRDSFLQQGMGQVDVNVSDQSRGWQQQAQQQQSGGDGQRGNDSGRSGGNDLIADGAPLDAASAAASAPLTVVGSSAVDYYA